MAFGRLRSLQIKLGCVRRGLRVQRATFECDALDLGLKPLLVLLTPVIAFLQPHLLLPIWLLILFLPGLPSALKKELKRRGSDEERRGRSSFSMLLSADDLNRSKLWRFLLTAALRDIMEYSVAGLVALPREVSGDLSSATSFELEAVDVADSCLVMDAVARLPDGVLFKYRIRTGLTLSKLGDGSNCLFWEDPSIRITPGWPLPEFWAPIGGFAGRRFSDILQLTRVDFPASGGLHVEGFAGSGSSPGALVPVRAA